MKRASNLIERATTDESLTLAWHKARRGRSRSRAVRDFERRLETNLERIGTALRQGRYEWGEFRSFIVYDPKEREISAPPFCDRVAQHALFNVCAPIFNNRQIENSFACRIGKGQTGAITLVRRYLSSGGYYLKMDVRKYFASIDRGILKNQLTRIIKDGYVLRAFYDAIDSFKLEDDLGVPLGSLASQFFANHYLTPLDYFVCNELRIGRYARYMDDFVLCSDSRASLKSAGDAIEDFLYERLHLTLKLRELRPATSGLSFLGMRVYPNSLRLCSRARLRFRRKYNVLLALFDQGALTELEFQQRAEALFAYVAQADSVAFRRRVIADGERRRTARTA